MKRAEQFFVEDPKLNNIFKALVVIGLVGIAGAFFQSPTKAWINILVCNFYFMTISLFGVFFLALTNIVGASFISPYKRVLEAMAGCVPYMGVANLSILIGAHTLYEWTHHDVVMADEILKQKMPYLNMPFFSGRLIAFVFIWTVIAYLFTKKSRQQDASAKAGETIALSFKPLAAVSMIIFALSFTLFSYDMIMSLEPHWFSTMFGVYTFSGLFVSGLSFVVITIIYLKSRGYLKNEINENHYHDLGKFMFGFTTWWAYIWFCQYLLIWYSNISEESEYYVLREHFGWDWIFWFNFVINWIVPFLILMPREMKRNANVLLKVAFIILIGQWINVYIMVAPKVMEHHGIHDPMISWHELVIALGYIGFFCLIFSRNLTKASLVPVNDPYLEEAIALKQ